ncbi:MAG: hypothetical protein KF749_07305 [Bacteroidetes bacterium]|nr:hypothetical protein [Bacteroidota bacterium]MCW5896579.1 hypothetical protein [Bacteroidota bacterium]
MERATKVVSFVIRLMRGTAFVITALFLLLSPVSANTKADFLVLGEVRLLFVYNQYQQQITNSEKAEFLPFTPFRILNPDDMLGDGFTPCMRVEVGNRIYFFEKDTGGQLAGVEGGMFQRTYRNATLLGDTVEVLSGNRVILHDPARTQKSPLAQGAVVVRLFEHQGFAYVRTLGAGSRFGWIQFGESRAERDWRILKQAGTSTLEQLERTLPLIRVRVQEVNATLSRLYDFFNRESSHQLQPPQWKVEQQGNTALCVLESAASADAFSESTRLLGKSIEGVILGTSLRVSSTPGRIEISGGEKK